MDLTDDTNSLQASNRDKVLFSYFYQERTLNKYLFLPTDLFIEPQLLVCAVGGLPYSKE